MAEDSEQLVHLRRLLSKLGERAAESKLLDEYYEGSPPFPKAIVDAKITNLYSRLMPMSSSPWGGLVVDSVQDRLEVVGISDSEGGREVEQAVWGLWQDNQMDAESKLAHNAALTAGRAFAIVWPNKAGDVEITLENSEQVVVEYSAGSRRKRVAAARQWTENDGSGRAVLYRPDGLWWFRTPARDEVRVGAEWIPVDDMFPVENPFDVVPVVELAVNRRLKPGTFGFARGEFANVTGLIDRINLLTFLGLVVALWMGFPIRGVMGHEVVEDDDGNPIPPFEPKPNAVVAIEDATAKTFEFAAADRKGLSIYPELDQLATLTKTPRHYMPMEHGMSNLSADAIRASEGTLVAKVPTHKGSLGEGYEEILRLGGLMLPEAERVELSRRAAIQWADHESRSLAERADAFSKLAPYLPTVAVAERVLDATADDLARWAEQNASSTLGQLVAAAQTVPTAPPTPAPELALNGNGAG